MLKAIGTALYERVILAYKSSLVAFALVVADVVISTLQTEPLPNWLHVTVGVAAFALASYKKAQPKAVAVPIPLEPPPSTGYALLGLLPALALACCLVLPVLARGDASAPTPPPMGGLFQTSKFGLVSYGPRILPGMLALNFKSGSVNAVAIGGLAYGITAFSDKPYAFGLAVFLGAQSGSPSAITAGIVATLMAYTAIGVHYGVTGGVHQWDFVAGPNIAF